MTHRSLTTVHCLIDTFEPLNHDVIRVWLQGPCTLRYQPGQYLEIRVMVANKERWLPFSIANACCQDGRIELHIQLQSESPALMALAAALESSATLTVRLPKGTCVLKEDNDRPLLLVAAATGLAQMKAIAEAALINAPQRSVELWWGGRTAKDLYLHEVLVNWAAATPSLSYFPVVEQAGEYDIDGVVARIDEALATHVQQHRHYSIFLSGSPGMVYSVIDSLALIEPVTEHLFSDVFSYAPRN